MPLIEISVLKMLLSEKIAEVDLGLLQHPRWSAL